MKTDLQIKKNKIKKQKQQQQKKLTFSSPVATTEFSKFADVLSAAFSQHHLLGFEVAQLEFHHLH